MPAGKASCSNMLSMQFDFMAINCASRYPDYNYNPKRRASLSETNNNLETKDAAKQNFPQPRILPRRSVRYSVRQSSQIAGHSQPAVHAKAVSGCKDSGYKKTEAGHHSVESSQCTFHSPDTHSDETAIMKQEIHHGQKWEEGITDYENLPGNPCFSFPMDEYEESNDNEVCEFSTSTSSCSSQVNTQGHLDCEYINFDDNGFDFGASLIPMSYSPKCWNEPSNDLLLPSTINRIAPFTMDGLDGYWLPYNPSSLYTSSSDNFGYGSY
jgi:hypothetical protein